MTWKVGISDDYAIMRGGKMQFYYGYEEINDNGDWLFQVIQDKELKMIRTAKQLEQDVDEEPVRVLLEGISRWLDSEQEEDDGHE